ncbi:MAG: HipA N-terminal domain-containing protein [Verrucomicrobiaceae bacterium]|nr:HipA N-terminal domain-containing protein [Verrucomicrobiaceae bacterium]
MLKSLYRRFNWLRDVSEPAQVQVAFELRLGDLHVGTLLRDGDEWVFNYSAPFARQRMVAPIVDFPVVGREYRSKELWPFFALRIPSVTQANVQAFLRRQGRTEADAADLMQEFGRRSIANPFVLETA